MIIENLELKLSGSLLVTREELLYIVSSWIPIETIELVNNVEVDIKVDRECYDLSKLDVSQITDFSNVFKDSPYNGDISNWNISNALNLDNMFYYSKFNGNLSKWDTSNIISMEGTFFKSWFDNNSISNWDVSKVKNMSNLFYSSLFTKDLSKWDVSSCTNMNGMFFRNNFVNNSIKNWNVSNVETMSEMFSCSRFNGDISNWDVSKVKNMEKMFLYSIFNGDISNWDISNCENMKEMFCQSKFNGDISKWNFNHNVICDNIFINNNNFINKYIITNNIPNETNLFIEWINENRENIQNIIKEKKEILKLKLEGKIPVTKEELIEIVNSWGRKCDHYNIFRVINESNNTFLSNGFIVYINKSLPKECYPLENLDVSQIDDLSEVFYYSYYNGDLSKWNISNCKNMYKMFMFASFDNNSINNWDIKNVENMEDMFYNSKFKSDLSYWEFNENINCKNIFFNKNFIDKYNDGENILDTSIGFLEWFKINKNKISRLNITEKEIIDCKNYFSF